MYWGAVHFRYPRGVRAFRCPNLWSKFLNYIICLGIVHKCEETHTLLPEQYFDANFVFDQLTCSWEWCQGRVPFQK